MHHDDAYTSQEPYWWEFAQMDSKCPFTESIEDTATLTDEQIWGEPLSEKPICISDKNVTQGGGG